jgi:hypothetical protein
MWRRWRLVRARARRDEHQRELFCRVHGSARRASDESSLRPPVGSEGNTSRGRAGDIHGNERRGLRHRRNGDKQRFGHRHSWINDDYLTTSTDSRLKVIVPPGSYLIGANSFNVNTLGTYSLTSAASTEEVANCEDVFVVPGIATQQSLGTTDCSTNGFFSDEYVVFLKPGQSVTVAMTSSTLDSYVEIRANGNPTVLASNDDIDATTKDARVTYAVPNTGTSTGGFFIIAAASRVAGATGAYTFSVQ